MTIRRSARGGLLEMVPSQQRRRLVLVAHRVPQFLDNAESFDRVRGTGSFAETDSEVLDCARRVVNGPTYSDVERRALFAELKKDLRKNTRSARVSALSDSISFNICCSLSMNRLSIPAGLAAGKAASLVASLSGGAWGPVDRWLVPCDPGPTIHDTAASHPGGAASHFQVISGRRACRGRAPDHRLAHAAPGRSQAAALGKWITRC